jgi:hypothetical protein
VTPKSPRERAVAVVLMILGVNMVGYVTSSIAAILNVRNSKQARIANKKQVRPDCPSTEALAKIALMRPIAGSSSSVNLCDSFGIEHVPHELFCLKGAACTFTTTVKTLILRRICQPQCSGIKYYRSS